MKYTNVFIAKTWQTMDIIERVAKEKKYPLQNSAIYKHINHLLDRLAKTKGENEILKFEIIYFLGKLSERVRRS